MNEGLGGGTLGVFAIDPGDASRQTLLGASGERTYRTTDGGRTWTAHGTVPVSVGVLAYAGDVVLASSGSGLYASNDGGVTFRERALAGLSLGTLTMHPEGLRGYAFAAGLGAVRTNDGGVTWGPVNRGLEGVHVQRLDVDPRDPDVVIAGTILLDPATGAFTGDGQLLQTTDGGRTWVEHDRVGGASYDLARCASDPSVLLSARRWGMFLSRDSGATWTALPPRGEQFFESAEISGAACDRIVAFTSFPAEGYGFYVGTAGDSLEGPFTEGFEVTRSARSAPELVVLTDTQLVAGTVSGPFVSSDFARSFRRVEGFLSMPVTDARPSGGTLWLGTYGVGVWALDRNATVWRRVPARDLDNEYAFSIFPRAGATFARGPVIVGGYGALVQRLEGTSAFTTVVNDGSPADNVFATTELPDGTLLTASQTEGIQRSEDGGATFRFSNDGIEPWLTLLGRLTDMRAITNDPSRPELVIAGGAGGGIWRSEDAGRRWVASGLDGEDIVGLFASSSPPRFYALVRGEGVFVSNDGRAWSAWNEGLPSLEVDGADVSDAGVVYLAAGGRVYQRGPSEPSFAQLEAGCGLEALRLPRVVAREDGEWLFVVVGRDGLARRALP